MKGTVIALLIFLFPVGLIGMWKGRHFSPFMRYAVTAMFTLPFVLGFAVMAADPRSFKEQAAEAQAQQAERQAERQAQKAAAALKANGGEPEEGLFSGNTSKGQAQVHGRTILERHLKSPSSVKYIRSVVMARTKDHCHYIMYFEVDAQNGFGATVRNAFLVLLKTDPKNSGKMAEEVLVTKCSNPPNKEEVQLLASGSLGTWTFTWDKDLN